MGKFLKVFDLKMVLLLTLFYRHMIRNSIEFNDLTGAVINIPLNFTFQNINEFKKAPWAIW